MKDITFLKVHFYIVEPFYLKAKTILSKFYSHKNVKIYKSVHFNIKSKTSDFIAMIAKEIK